MLDKKNFCYLIPRLRESEARRIRVNQFLDKEFNSYLEIDPNIVWETVYYICDGDNLSDSKLEMIYTMIFDTNTPPEDIYDFLTKE